MNVRAIPAEVIAAYVVGLSQYIPELTPTRFVAALRAFEPDTEGGKPETAPAPMLSLEQAAAALSVSVCTVRRMVKSGRLPGRKVSKLWRIPAAAIRDLAEFGEDRQAMAARDTDHPETRSPASTRTGASTGTPRGY